MTAFISGLLLVVMGVLVTVLAFTATAMSPGGWQARLSANLRHYADIMLSWIDGVPGWITLAAVVTAVTLLAWRAIRQHLDDIDDTPAAPVDEPVAAGNSSFLAEIAGSEGEP